MIVTLQHMDADERCDNCAAPIGTSHAVSCYYVQRPAFTPTQVQEAAHVIARAKAALGTRWIDAQLSDLLMDNLRWLKSCDDARALIAQLSSLEA